MPFYSSKTAQQHRRKKMINNLKERLYFQMFIHNKNNDHRNIKSVQLYPQLTQMLKLEFL